LDPDQNVDPDPGTPKMRIKDGSDPKPCTEEIERSTGTDEPDTNTQYIGLISYSLVPVGDEHQIDSNSDLLCHIIVFFFY